MVHKIIFNDKSKLFHHWINKLNFPKEIEFKSGINILIGENGCGKTSLLNIIRYYTMCDKEFYSRNFKEGQYKLKNSFTEEFQNGADLIADYTKPIFNLRTSDMLDHCSGLENFDNFTQTYVKLNTSSGEDTWASLNKLFKLMFDENHVDNFNMLNSISDDEIKQYYVKNQLNDNVYTILMDEPDRGLDINKLKELFNILSFQRSDMQIIICIHNPALIYKLYNTHKCNFIELSNGYLNKVLNFLK